MREETDAEFFARIRKQAESRGELGLFYEDPILYGYAQFLRENNETSTYIPNATYKNYLKAVKRLREMGFEYEKKRYGRNEYLMMRKNRFEFKASELKELLMLLQPEGSISIDIRNDGKIDLSLNFYWVLDKVN